MVSFGHKASGKFRNRGSMMTLADQQLLRQHYRWTWYVDNFTQVKEVVDISIPGLAAPIVGSAPVVILGANGSGKIGSPWK